MKEIKYNQFTEKQTETFKRRVAKLYEKAHLADLLRVVVEGEGEREMCLDSARMASGEIAYKILMLKLMNMKTVTRCPVCQGSYVVCGTGVYNIKDGPLCDSCEMARHLMNMYLPNKGGAK
jgi:hypothetical protein